MTGISPGAGRTPILSGGLELSGGDRRQGVQDRGADTPQQEGRIGAAGHRGGTPGSILGRNVLYEEVHQATTRRTSRDNAGKESEEEEQVQGPVKGDQVTGTHRYLNS